MPAYSCFGVNSRLFPDLVSGKVMCKFHSCPYRVGNPVLVSAHISNGVLGYRCIGMLMYVSVGGAVMYTYLRQCTHF